MASESPFDRLGTLVIDDRDEVRAPLYGGANENAFTVAHRAVGEWRAWRQLMELNGLADPFDLSERQVVPQGDIVVDDVNVTTDMGQGLEVLNFTDGISGTLELRVDDVADGEFDLTLSAGGLGAGAPVRVTEADFNLPGGFIELTLPLPSSRSVTVRFDLETFLVLWLMRCEIGRASCRERV